MTETAHTPGPWFVPDQALARETCIQADYGIACPGSGGAMSYTTTVCTLGWNSITPEWEANARLIAAAPDLLEALKEVVSEYDNPDNGRSLRWAIDEARAAIARATGEKEADP